ncbi:MAG: shikimate kinase [Thaumarchaeota archaeon]|nr:shikimate kinase [Nitrososphaerota archaeon]MCL5318727.1 shikimate kinase [Nitrososphaerota archaeon]
MKGRAVAHGAVSIVNAISTWKGAALGVNLKTEAEVRIQHTRGNTKILFEGDAAKDSILAEITVKEVLRRFSEEPFEVTVATKSEIPAGKGLKSSSTASNAVALATLSALGKKDIDDLSIVNLGVDASLKAGVTITGAFDDACASYFGGFVVTDNKERKLLRKEVAPTNIVILFYVPEERIYTKDFDKSKITPFKAEVLKAFNLALRGEYWKAMTMNGQIHSTALGLTLKPAKSALDAGALASGLSGTGPAVAAVCRSDTVRMVKAGWRDLPGTVIETLVNNSVAEGEGSSS